MKIDLNKIKATLDKLNEKTETKPWIEVGGYNIMPQLNVDTEPPTVLSGSGIFVKTFVNKETSEMRLFPLLMFAPEPEK